MSINFKGFQVCSHCASINSLYAMNCSSCQFVLRNKISNIDLWDTIFLIIESPKEAFTKIVQSEKKNFIFFLALFAGFKFFINAHFIAVVLNWNLPFNFTSGFYFSVVLLILTLLLSYILRLLLHPEKTNTRLKDHFASVIYSFIPLILALLVLQVSEFVIFGENLLNKEPSPFLIQISFAYLFLGLELASIIWSTIILARYFLLYGLKNLYAYFIGFFILLCFHSVAILYIYLTTQFGIF